MLFLILLNYLDVEKTQSIIEENFLTSFLNGDRSSNMFVSLLMYLSIP